MRFAHPPRQPRTTAYGPRKGAILLIILVVSAAALYLGWRIPHDPGSQATTDDLLLIASGIMAASTCIWASLSAGPGRRGWILVAMGCTLWAVAQSIRTTSTNSGILVYTTAFLISVSLLMLGCGLLAGFGRGMGGYRQLCVDMVPPFTAVLIAVWLSDVGPFLQRYEVPRAVGIAALAHGLSSTGLIVLGMTGILASYRLRLAPGLQSLMTGMAIIAIADAFWMQRWIDREINFGVAADVAFCVGFVAVAVGALQERLLPDTGRLLRAEPVVAVPIAPLAAPITLLALFALIAAQTVWGEWTPHGTVITAVGGLIVVGFVLMWEHLVTERESALAEEIDVLSERIDGLISQVGRDPLTGLLNRRAFQERLDHELVIGRTRKASVVLALIDVDNFKQVNDNLGHQVGDQVLQAVASVLIGAARATDVVARYAGDEFVMIFPGITEEDAATVGHRMLEHVRLIGDQISALGGDRTSLSIGLAITHCCKRNASQLTAIADAAMYDAKEGGKDRLVAINADTLTAAAWWGAEPATSAVLARDDRRGTGPLSSSAGGQSLLAG